MPWDGSGVFNRLYNWVTDASNGIDITASRFDADEDDITTQGLGNCLTRDGQGFATANLPMAGFKHTGVGNATAATQYVALGQLQSPGAIAGFFTSLTITVGGITVQAGGAAITGTLALTGAMTISLTLTVTGVTSLNGGLVVVGAMTVSSTSSLHNTTVTGTLGVTGLSTLTGGASLGAALAVTAGGATVSGQTTLTGINTSSGSQTILVQNSSGGGIIQGNNDGRVVLAGTPSFTTASAANLFIDVNGILSLSTSSRRYKRMIREYPSPLAAARKLRAIKFKSRAKSDGSRWFAGFGAEDVHDAGLHEFVTYDNEGRPNGVEYGPLSALAIGAANALADQVDNLERRLTALENMKQRPPVER